MNDQTGGGAGWLALLDIIGLCCAVLTLVVAALKAVGA
jgi:hypothetical protein